MWVPKLKYTVEFDPGEPDPEEEDEEGMEWIKAIINFEVYLMNKFNLF